MTIQKIVFRCIVGGLLTLAMHYQLFNVHSNFLSLSYDNALSHYYDPL